MGFQKFKSLKQFRMNRPRMSFPALVRRLGFIGLFIIGSFSNLNPAFSGGKDFQLSRRDKIFALHYFDKDTCWAVGIDGLILKTVDGGNTWEQRGKITNLPLNDIFFINNKGWIVGGNGLILNTEDGGSSWKKQPKISEASLMKVLFLDEHRGFIVGGNGTVLYTENGGILWQTFPLDWPTILTEDLILGGVLSPNLYDIFFVDATYGWIVGDNGIVFKSSDGGEHWELLRIGLFPPLFSVFFKNGSEGWAAGQNGLLLHSEDGGKSWVELKVPVEASLFNICMRDKFGLIVGDKGTILQTSNGGLAWSPLGLELSLPFPYFADAWIIPSSSPQKIIFVGERIIKTTIQ